MNVASFQQRRKYSDRNINSKFSPIINKYVRPTIMTTITVLLYFLLLSLPSPFAISEEEKYSTTCSVTLIIVGQTISRNWTAMLLNGLRRKSRVSSGNYASALLTPWPSMPPSIFIRERKIILPFSPNFPLAPTCANFPRDYPRLVVDEAGYIQDPES